MHVWSTSHYLILLEWLSKLVSPQNEFSDISHKNSSIKYFALKVVSLHFVQKLILIVLSFSSCFPQELQPHNPWIIEEHPWQYSQAVREKWNTQWNQRRRVASVWHQKHWICSSPADENSTWLNASQWFRSECILPRTQHRVGVHNILHRRLDMQFIEEDPHEVVFSDLQWEGTTLFKAI